MLRRTYLTLFLTLGLISLGSAAAVGQIAPVRGEVKLQKPDGTTVPAADMLVEVYRTDIDRGVMPSAKTNKRGEFSFAGLPLGQTFALAVSGTGVGPRVEPNVKAGRENIVIVVNEGDGRKLSETEVREVIKAVASAPAGAAQNPEELKKAQAEHQKKMAEVSAKNKEIENKNAVIQRSLNEGNEAFKANNFDLAVVKYTEGIAADPDYVGSAPVLLNNRGVAHRVRALHTYNASVKGDAATKVEGFGKAKKDLGDSVESYMAAWTILSKAAASEIADQNAYNSAKGDALRGARDTLKLMVQTEQLDETKLPAAKTLLEEYAKFETDAAKKAEARLILADLYRVAADSENAIAAYKAILTESPDNVDALAGVGLSLVNLGYINNNKEMLQEGANYLQKFASSAPDTHRYKDDAVGLIDTLKKEQNVTPQKVATPRRNRP